VSLTDWLNEKLFTQHNPAPDEVVELLHICDRDLENELKCLHYYENAIS
jgi:hypothetical protein